MSRKVLGVVVTVVALAVVIGAALWFGGKQGRGGATPSPTQQRTVVRGLVGSEKKSFFDDPRVKEAFAKAGYEVQIDTAGSRAQLEADPKSYDFFFPGSAPVADEIAAKVKGKKFAAFYSPLVIYTFKDVAATLEANGLVKGTTFDVAAYQKMVAAGTRWSDLKKVPPELSSPKAVMVTTSNPSASNSALMFASLAGYVANGNKVVSSEAEVTKVAPMVKQLFANQGYTESSSEGPFEDYLALGAGKTPLLVGYESQLLAHQIAKDPQVTDQMVILTPNPGMICKHTLVSTTAQGEAIGRLLTENEELGTLVATYGFRTAKAPVFAKVVTEAGLKVPPISASVTDPSPYAILDSLVTAIKK